MESGMVTFNKGAYMKMQNKHITATFLALTLIFCLASCGSSAGGKGSESKGSQSAEKSSAVSEASKSTPAAESTQASSSTQADASASSQPAASAAAPVQDAVSVRMEGDTLYLSGTGIVTFADVNHENYKQAVNLVVEAGITGIGDSAFVGFGSLQSVTFSEGLKTIGMGAFESCGLRSVTLPDSLQTIGDMAFNRCEKLETVTFGSGLTEIVGPWTFYNCFALTTINAPSSIQSVIEAAEFGNDMGSLVVYH